jgi:hypothetical protein
MNWTELRVKLRQQYGNKIGFFNDKRSNGKRRVKIYGSVNNKTLKRFIRKQDSNLEIHDHDWITSYSSCGVIKSVVVYFNA